MAKAGSGAALLGRMAGSESRGAWMAPDSCQNSVGLQMRPEAARHRPDEKGKREGRKRRVQEELSRKKKWFTRLAGTRMKED